MVDPTEIIAMVGEDAVIDTQRTPHLSVWVEQVRNVSERASVFVQAVYGKQIRRTQTIAGSSAARFDKEIHFVWTEKDATHVFHNNDLIISLKQVL